MATTNRRLSTLAALLVLALLFIALLALNQHLLRGLRLDLTENRLHTLTEGTGRILGRIEEPIDLHFYWSDQAARDLPSLRTYAVRVRELLEEMVARSGGRLRFAVIDPQPFSEDEDRATAAGLQGIALGNSGQTLFFGLLGRNAVGNEAAIPFFQPDKEAFLEYDVAKLISALVQDARPQVGLLSTLPMAPSLNQGMGRVDRGWVMDQQLRSLFDLRPIEPDAKQLPDDLDALVLVHPRKLDEDMLYAIDQFVLKGGRLLAFVDPDAEAQPDAPGVDPLQALSEGRGSDLPLLFQAWGVAYDPGRVVLDAQRALEIQLQTGTAPVRHPALLGLGPEDANTGDVVTAQLGVIHLSSAGFFAPVEGGKAKLETLLQTSPQSASVDVERLVGLVDPGELYADFNPSGEPHAVAVRVTGLLPSAFAPRPGALAHLEASREPAQVILIADTDVLTDRLWAQVQSFFGQEIVNAFASNGDLVINAVDNLIGSADLISVRTRAGSTRPFSTVEALRAEADARFRANERHLQTRLDETEEKLAALQKARDDGNALSLNSAQQEELLRFQDEKLQIRKALRQVRRQLDEDIQSLGRRLKFLNIVGMPVVISALALLLVFWRRARHRARA